MPSTDSLFGDGTTVKAYRRGLVQRFTNAYGSDTDKAIDSAKLVEGYIVAAKTDDDRDTRRQAIEAQLNLRGQNVDQALDAVTKIDAYINGGAAT